MKTKNIISLILAGIMVVSLVACGKNTDSPEIEEPTEDEYEYVEVVKPDLKPSSTNINFTAENGNTFSGEMVVSPLNKEDFNINKTLEALKELKYLGDWGAIRYETVERAYERAKEDGQQLTPYERTESIIAEQIRDEIPTGNEVIIDYWNDTESCINYNNITVRFGNSEEYNGLTNEQKSEILNIVFGEEVGKFLFEVKFDEDFNASSCYVEYDAGTMSYSREIEDGYAIYSVGCTGNFEILEGYPSEEVWMETPSVLYDFMKLPADERDVCNLNTFAKSFLGKYFGEGARITSDIDFLYVWNTTEGTDSNGPISRKNFHINTGIYLPDVDEEDCPSILIDDCYENGEHDMSVFVSFNYKDKSEWTEEEKKEIRQTAMTITRDILGIEDIEKYFDGDEFYDMTINGREEWVHVSFTWEDYDEETEHAYLHIMTSTDMSRRY